MDFCVRWRRLHVELRGSPRSLFPSQMPSSTLVARPLCKRLLTPTTDWRQPHCSTVNLWRHWRASVDHSRLTSLRRRPNNNKSWAHRSTRLFSSSAHLTQHFSIHYSNNKPHAPTNNSHEFGVKLVSVMSLLSCLRGSCVVMLITVVDLSIFSLSRSRPFPSP